MSKSEHQSDQKRAQTDKSSEKERLQVKDADIVSLILEDHEPLKELIEIMKDSDRSMAERENAFDEFAPILIAHAKPEEEVLYKRMKKDEELREEGFEGDVEHSIADQLVEEIKRTQDQDLRSARIKVLAELVEHHIEEEEDDLLPDFKAHCESEERVRMGNRFMELKLRYLAAGGENIIPDPKADRLQAEKARNLKH